MGVVKQLVPKRKQKTVMEQIKGHDKGKIVAVHGSVVVLAIPLCVNGASKRRIVKSSNRLPLLRRSSRKRVQMNKQVPRERAPDDGKLANLQKCVMGRPLDLRREAIVNVGLT